jgi:hypothetical protein
MEPRMARIARIKKIKSIRFLNPASAPASMSIVNYQLSIETRATSPRNSRGRKAAGRATF